MEKGLIIGKGWLGSRLEFYLEKNYTISTTKRNSDADNCYSIDFDNYNSQKLSENYDFIIVTIPFGRRNSIEELNLRFNHLIEFLEGYKGQIILISSTAIYPETNDFVTETTFDNHLLNQPYQFIEEKLKMAFPQLIILRLGGLMGDDRFLSKYINFDKPNLKDVTNHIHYQDINIIVSKIISKNIRSEIYNIVAPEHPTKREVLEFQFHQNIIKSTIKNGKTIVSEKIIHDLNYQFIFPNPLYFKE